MPYLAHKRLVTIIHTPVHHVYYSGAMVPIRVRARVRPSILAAELNRIRDLPRPTTRSYIEEYLNSRNNIVSSATNIQLTIIFLRPNLSATYKTFTSVNHKNMPHCKRRRHQRSWIIVFIVIVVILHWYSSWVAKSRFTLLQQSKLSKGICSFIFNSG